MVLSGVLLLLFQRRKKKENDVDEQPCVQDAAGFPLMQKVGSPYDKKNISRQCGNGAEAGRGKAERGRRPQIFSAVKLVDYLPLCKQENKGGGEHENFNNILRNIGDAGKVDKGGDQAVNPGNNRKNHQKLPLFPAAKAADRLHAEAECG